MIGKRSYPKNRPVCKVCAAWLLEADLARTGVCEWPDPGQKCAAPGLQRQLSTSSSLESGEIREDLDGSESDSATESLAKKAKVSMPEYLDRHEASADWAVPRIAADGEDAAVGEHLAECTLLRSDATLPPHPPCKLLVAGRALALVTSPYAVPRTAAYGEDAAELESCYYGNKPQLACHCRELA